MSKKALKIEIMSEIRDKNSEFFALRPPLVGKDQTNWNNQGRKQT